jgi:hypothetical protein
MFCLVPVLGFGHELPSSPLRIPGCESSPERCQQHKFDTTVPIAAYPAGFPSFVSSYFTVAGFAGGVFMGLL